MIRDKIIIEIEAKNLSQLFEQAALRLAEILSRDLAPKIKRRTIKLKAVDENSLLYEWIIYLLKLADEQNLVIKNIKLLEMTDIELVAGLEVSESYIPIEPVGSLSSDISIKDKKDGFGVKLIFE